jgi:uncharacterized membrane protein YidH (DUF202 family)
MQSSQPGLDQVAINEAQLILAEKRTSLAVMRTGIAVLALPLSVLSFLIATSKHYDFIDVAHLIVPLLVLCLLLVAFGASLIVLSINRMRYYDHLVSEIKKKHSSIAEFIK